MTMLDPLLPDHFRGLNAHASRHEFLHQSPVIREPATCGGGNEFIDARIESADLTDIQPAEYRADLVVLLLDERPLLGIIIEAQLARDDAKHSVQIAVAAITASAGLDANRSALYVDRQATLKFGALSNEVQARIRSTSAAVLDQVGERLLGAATLDDWLESKFEDGNGAVR